MNHANPFKGHKLKAIRKQQCFTQYEVSRGIGYNDANGATIGRFERGNFRPCAAIEEKLCTFFKVSADYFRI